MGSYLNPTNKGFRESLASEIYVDKSGLIAYTNQQIGTEQKFICVSRPRRFGKSMAAKMLTAYYCRTCDSQALFQNLKIAQDDIVNITLHFFLKDVRSMLPPAVNHSIAVS